MKTKVKNSELTHFLKNNCIKVNTKDQARQLVAHMKKAQFKFHWAVVYENVKRGSLFTINCGKLTCEMSSTKPIFEFKNIEFE